MQASDAGSLLSLPNLTTINGGTYSGQGVHINAYNGATTNLPKLTTISQGRAQLQASGKSGVLNISSLASLIGSRTDGFGTAINISNGGEVFSPKLAQVELAVIQVSNAGSTLNAPVLSDINNTSVSANQGGR